MLKVRGHKEEEAKSTHKLLTAHLIIAYFYFLIFFTNRMFLKRDKGMGKYKRKTARRLVFTEEKMEETKRRLACGES